VPKEILKTQAAPQPSALFSQGTAGGGLLFTAQVGLLPSGKIVPGGVDAQTRQSLTNVQAVVESAGGDLSDVLQVTVYLLDLAEVTAVNRVYAEFFPSEPPSRACIGVAALPPGVLIEIQAVARRACPSEVE
jgi:2-iminobutanoate/2-iminopropanoate deaminase